MDINILLLAALSMATIGALLAIGLVIADKKLKIEVDPLLTQILDALPGINCGACGYPGCAGAGEAVFRGEATVSVCPVGGDECAEALSIILGVDSGESIEAQKAVLHCAGGKNEAKETKEYYGVQTCASAHLVGGKKGCSFGCLGYGDCEAACPFGAITVNENGIPVVDREKCTGCTNCVAACPRSLFKMHSEKDCIIVRCSSTEKGAVCRKICDVACIGCGICARECKFGAIEIINNLAIVDDEKCKGCSLCVKKCPTGAIVNIKKGKIKNDKV